MPRTPEHPTVHDFPSSIPADAPPYSGNLIENLIVAADTAAARLQLSEAARLKLAGTIALAQFEAALVSVSIAARAVTRVLERDPSPPSIEWCVVQLRSALAKLDAAYLEAGEYRTRRRP